ncbi:hypothetical protein COBT_003612 [Conglomerata obtusa]
MNFLPLELLEESKNKKIRIYLKKEKLFEGQLVEYDEHGNLFLEDCCEYNSDGYESRIGSVVINGGSVAIIDIV